MLEKNSSPLSEDGGQLMESGNKVKGSDADTNLQTYRKLYGLFILPVIFIFAGIFCGYVRNMLFDHVRRLNRMLDNHIFYK